MKVTTGVLVALFVLRRRALCFEIEWTRLFKWTWLLAVAAAFGGRLGYVIGNAAYFVEHPGAIFRLDQVGGLHGSSALVGGLLVVLIWAKTSSLRFRCLLDCLVPAVLLIAASAWWGCADVGCAWGREVLVVSDWQRWLVAELPNIYRVVEPRYAVQPIGAIWALLLTVMAVVRQELGSIALVAYLLGAAGLTFLRADVVLRVGSLRADLVLNLALAGFVFASILLDARNASGTKLEKP